jgi:hypothetical protein
MTSSIPQDFLDIDPNADHWHKGQYDGTPWFVPATETGDGVRLTDMTDAMMSDIPGQDDTVIPIKLHDQRFYKFAWTFLMQDGNLGVPGGRYGSDTRTCAEVAIIMSLIMQYHNGEAITYYQLNSDMGMVVNSSDDVAHMILEYGELVMGEKMFEFDVADYLSEDDIVHLPFDIGGVRRAMIDAKDYEVTDIVQKIQRALAGNDNDFDHDALVAVADFLGFPYRDGE